MGGVLSALGGGFADQVLRKLKSDLRLSVRNFKRTFVVFAVGMVFLLCGTVFLALSFFFAAAEMTKFAQAGLWTFALSSGIGFLLIKISGEFLAQDPKTLHNNHHAKQLYKNNPQRSAAALGRRAANAITNGGNHNGN